MLKRREATAWGCVVFVAIIDALAVIAAVTAWLAVRSFLDWLCSL